MNAVAVVGGFGALILVAAVGLDLVGWLMRKRYGIPTRRELLSYLAAASFGAGVLVAAAVLAVAS